MAVETTEADVKAAVRAAGAALFEHESRADSAPIKSTTSITKTGACWEVTFPNAGKFCPVEFPAPVRHINECWQQR
jgi:hypothetical protein